MKIAVNTGNYEILNSLIRQAKEHGNDIVIAKIEDKLFSHIGGGELDAFVISNNHDYSQKAVDFIKKSAPYTPVIVIGLDQKATVIGSDSMVPFNKESDTDFFAKSILHNIYAYSKNFEILQKLTAKTNEPIKYKNVEFDPTSRLLYYKGKEINKLSPKQAGLMEILLANYGSVVRKEVIMEKVWHESNYFVGRSLDVYTTHLRKKFKEFDLPMAITNVTNVGLVLNDVKK